jgi:hypothetical protein
MAWEVLGHSATVSVWEIATDMVMERKKVSCGTTEKFKQRGAPVVKGAALTGLSRTGEEQVPSSESQAETEYLADTVTGT